MDIVIPRNDLSRVLARAASIAAVKSPTTALTCVLLDANDGRLNACATSLMLGIETSATATVKASGKVGVNAKKAADIAKSMPAGDVRLRLVKGQLEVSNANAGAKGKPAFKLGTVDVELFPALPDSRASDVQQVASFEAKTLARLIAQGGYAMANDESRPEQMATYLDIEATTARALSTDRLRLASAQATLAATPAKLLIPMRSIQEIKKLADGAKDGAVSLSLHGSNAFFASDDQVIVVKLNDDVFPPVRKIGEAGMGSVKQWITLPREQLIESIKRVALVAIESGGKYSVLFSFAANGELRISGADAANEAEDVVLCDSAIDLEVEVPHAFLEQACSVLADDEVMLGVSEPKAPVLIRGASAPDDCFGLVMPIAKQGK